MNTKSFSILISSLVLASTGAGNCSVATSTGASSTVIGSINSGSRDGSTAEAILVGGHGVIALNGDTVEVRDGKLTLNGVPYGMVDEHSVIRYTVKGKVKRLFVDGLERKPSL